ncbi:unnamed protein product [Eruca vesicaria subsp. sativa]|uniref:Uncharacterized protein n=1 Tax=Eruca vesicaria subsp. sativa TaxID=29727 RepID=A0ABC8L3K1_ERUVS|nr:unnamed protein product [Eruca vesicaria subsp. sativa]
MDPNHPSNTPLVPGHVTPPNQPILLRTVSLSPLINGAYSIPQFQPRPQFVPQSQLQTPTSQPPLPTIIDPPYHSRMAVGAADLEAPRSEVPPTNISPLSLLANASASSAASAPQPQKRGRGRPPKARPEPIDAQPISVSYGQSSRGQQPELPVTSPRQLVGEPTNRGPGRPRRDGSVPNAPTAGAVLALEAPSVAARMERGRKRGPGRPSKIRRNRPRKSATPMSIWEVTGTQDSAVGELKRKLDLACEKAKAILEVLKAGIGSDHVTTMSQVRPALEGLIPILTVEPHGVGQGQPHAVEEVDARAVEQPEAMEEVQPEEAMDEAQI